MSLSKYHEAGVALMMKKYPKFEKSNFKRKAFDYFKIKQAKNCTDWSYKTREDEFNSDYEPNYPFFVPDLFLFEDGKIQIIEVSHTSQFVSNNPNAIDKLFRVCHWGWIVDSHGYGFTVLEYHVKTGVLAFVDVLGIAMLDAYNKPEKYKMDFFQPFIKPFEICVNGNWQEIIWK